MKTYLILTAIFGFIIGLSTSLRLGILIRIYFLKKIFPDITVIELTDFEEKPKIRYFWSKRRET